MLEFQDSYFFIEFNRFSLISKICGYVTRIKVSTLLISHNILLECFTLDPCPAVVLLFKFYRQTAMVSKLQTAVQIKYKMVLSLSVTVTNAKTYFTKTSTQTSSSTTQATVCILCLPYDSLITEQPLLICTQVPPDSSYPYWILIAVVGGALLFFTAVTLVVVLIIIMYTQLILLLLRVSSLQSWHNIHILL